MNSIKNLKLCVNILLIGMLMSCNYFGNNEKQNNNIKTTATVDKQKINLGSLKRNIPRKCVFTVQNTGKSPLLIQNVETSCGCTLPEWTKHPVKPGKSGEVRVTYDAEYPGRFHKTITVYANVESPIRLTVSGEVEFEE